MLRAGKDLDGVDATEIAFFVQNINNICAVCLQLHENCRTSNMQDKLPVSNTIEVYKLIESISLLKYSEKIPQLLCITCSFKLVDIYEFQQMCNKSHFYFNEYIKQEVTQDTTELEIDDEELCGICSDSEDLVAKASEGIDNESREISRIPDTCNRTSETTTEVIPVTKTVSDATKLDEIENGIMFCTEIQASTCNDLIASQSSQQHSKEHLGLAKNEYYIDKREFPRNYHVCPICSKSYTYQDSLTNHMRQHIKHFENDKISKVAKSTKKVSPESEIGRTDTTGGDGVINERNFGLSSSSNATSTLIEMKVAPVIDHQASRSVELTEHDAHPKERPDLEKKECYGKQPLHTEERPFKCNLCTKAFGTRGILCHHKRTHRTERRWHCERCAKAFKSKEALNGHMASHVNARSHVCSICSKGFNNRGGLRSHMQAHINGTHKPTISSRKIYQCKQCAKSFIHVGVLRRHALVHSEERPYACTLCDKKFKTQAILSRHILTHSGIRPFVCSHCNNAFSQKSDLESHILRMHKKSESTRKVSSESEIGRTDTTAGDGVINEKNGIDPQTSTSVELTEPDAHPKERADLEKKESCDKQPLHTEERPFKCNQCAKAFVTRRRLYVHKSVHTTGRGWFCEHCAKAFTSKGAFNYHMATHVNARSHVCPICSKGFNNRGGLRSHMQTHINDADEPKTSSETAHQCKQCAKFFISASVLQSHVRVHSEERPYACTLCDKNFKVKSALTRHMFIHSGIRPFVCSYCNKQFIQKCHFNLHLRIHQK